MTKDVRALCFDGEVTLREVDAPTPGPGHALIALRLAGICGTDLEVTRGYRGYRGILGHEFVGEVVRCPDAPTWEGKRVTGEINLGCGRCERCLASPTAGPVADMAKHCDSRRVMGIFGYPGCFAERLVLPIANLHAVPDTISDEHAVFTEPLAAAFEIFESVALDPSTRVAVLGDGRLGLLIGLALHSRGVRVVAVGRHARKLALVAGLGVEICGPEQELEDRSFDVVVEATGSRHGLERALTLVRPRGTVVCKSTVQGAVELDSAALVVDEIRVVGSRCGPFDVALAALAEGLVDPRPLIDARYPLDDAEAAMAHAQRRGTLKVLLYPRDHRFCVGMSDDKGAESKEPPP